MGYLFFYAYSYIYRCIKTVSCNTIVTSVSPHPPLPSGRCLKGRGSIPPGRCLKDREPLTSKTQIFSLKTRPPFPNFGGRQNLSSVTPPLPRYISKKIHSPAPLVPTCPLLVFSTKAVRLRCPTTTSKSRLTTQLGITRCGRPGKTLFDALCLS